MMGFFCFVVLVFVVGSCSMLVVLMVFVGLILGEILVGVGVGYNWVIMSDVLIIECLCCIGWCGSCFFVDGLWFVCVVV